MRARARARMAWRMCRDQKRQRVLSSLETRTEANHQAQWQALLPQSHLININFESGSCVAQVGLTEENRELFPYVHLPKAGMTGTSHNTQLKETLGTGSFLLSLLVLTKGMSLSFG